MNTDQSHSHTRTGKIALHFPPPPNEIPTGDNPSLDYPQSQASAIPQPLNSEAQPPLTHPPKLKPFYAYLRLLNPIYTTCLAPPKPPCLQSQETRDQINERHIRPPSLVFCRRRWLPGRLATALDLLAQSAGKLVENVGLFPRQIGGFARVGFQIV